MIARLRGGFHPPGQRFFSNRGLANQFGISYQTADRLIRELVDEGWLERKASSGTFVSGKAVDWLGAALVFHQRAKRKGSFGARLHDDLTKSLAESAIRTTTHWHHEQAKPIPSGWLPVIWECPDAVAALANARRFALVLNDTPPAGLASTYVDSIACDDFSGGAMAAEILTASQPQGPLAILAGPQTDHRSRQRVAGFQSIAPAARVFWAESWEAEAASQLARKITRPSSIFCCSDRLAEGLLTHPINASIVGFDDAPVAETLDLTTIAMPWHEMVRNAVEIIRRRIHGDTGPAAKHIIAPRPVVRSSHLHRNPGQTEIKGIG